MTFRSANHGAQGRRIAVGLAFLAALVAMFVFFAPSQLGGSTTYSITAGISMEPMLHKGDLVLVRAQPTYKVKDVVLYQSPVLHRPVLHRILVIQHGHYFFKGDNNNFVDPGYATRSELTGKLWLRAPALGGVLGWVGTPSHAGIVAALTVVFLLLSGTGVTKRRRRRRGPTPAKPPRATRKYMPPIVGATLFSLSGLVLVGLVLCAVGFGSPSSRIVPRPNAFQHTGTFSYRARPIKPSPFYPNGVAVTGQTLLANVIDTTDFFFKYRFVSPLPHQVHGTIELKGLILSQSSTWQNLYAVEAKTAFKGDSAITGGPLKLTSLFTTLNQISTAAGTPGAEYSIILQPTVHIVGTVGGKSIDSTFSPVLPFSASATQVKLVIAAAVAPPGATYQPPSQADSLNATVKPAQAGSIPGRAANLVSIARYAIPVFTIRILGLLMLVLAALVAIIHDRIVRRHVAQPVEEQIAAHLGCLVTPIDALALPAGSAPTPVHDFLSLATLARYLERPILRLSDATARTYIVDDETRVYGFHALAVAELAAVAAPPPTRSARDRVGRPSRRFTIAGAAVVLVVATALVTSFTATTTVPTSNIGASNVPRQIHQLTPPECTPLSLTGIVFVPVQGKFTNNASNTLVVGTSGDDDITDHGKNNCIVGGAGKKDVVAGDNTDICVIGPDRGARYNKCTAI